MIEISKKWGYLLILLFVLSACKFEDIQFKGAENFKLKQLEGKTISLSFDAILQNPNKYTLKIKPSTLDLHINGDHVGVVHLDEKIAIHKMSDGKVSIPVTAELQNGALPKLIAAALRKTASVGIKGIVKGQVGIFSKKKEINETREIPLSDLKLLNLPF